MDGDRQETGPRRLATGRWQDAAEAATDSDAPPPSRRPARRAWWRRRAGCGLSVIGLLLLLAAIVRPDLDPRASGASPCNWGAVSIEVPARARGLATGRDCYVADGDLRLAFRIFFGDKAVDAAALKREYGRRTGVSSRFAAASPPADLLTSPRLLFLNRIPVSVHRSPDRRRGYVVAEISETTVIVGRFAAPRPVSPERVRRAFLVRLNPDRLLLWWSLQIKLVQVIWLFSIGLPLAAVLGHRAIFRWFDRWWNARSPLGLALYAGTLLAAGVGYGWFLFGFLGWSTVFLVTAALTGAAWAMMVRNLVRDRGPPRLLAPVAASGLPIFRKLSLSERSVEIVHAKVPLAHALEAVAWVPRRAHCPACGLDYAVYVPGVANRILFEGIRGPSDIPRDVRREVRQEAFAAAPPLRNGCIRCGGRLDSDGGESRAFTRDNMAVGRGCIASAAAMLILAVAMASTQGLPRPPLTGWIGGLPLVGPSLDYLLDEFAMLTIALLTTPALYLAWRAVARLSDVHVVRASRWARMWACARDGLLFEDMSAQHDMVCPRCHGKLEPLRRFRIAPAAPPGH